MKRGVIPPCGLEVSRGLHVIRRRRGLSTTGAAAMMAVVITHPVDQTKIRTQLQRSYTSMLATATQTVRMSSGLGLWQGLSGSLLRQATYGTARFGVYNKLEQLDKHGHRRSSRVLNGAIAGAVSGIVGAPAGTYSHPFSHLYG